MGGQRGNGPARSAEIHAGARRDQRERELARLATHQHGVVTRAQLLGAGLGRDAIDRRLRCGRLHRLHRGVYLLGHAAPADGAAELAAVLACGPGAVLSHHSAAARWQLLLPAPGMFQVTVPGRNAGSKPGIRVHRVRSLARRDVRIRDRIPLTSPGRTITDLAGVLPPEQLERAVAEAEARRLISRTELRRRLARARGRRGAPALRRLLEDPKAPLTRSEAERRLLALIRAAELPHPRTNVRVAGHEVDFLWREKGVVVEVDGFRYHSSRAAFERDRLRDARLAAHGLRVVRVTWRQIAERPYAVVARLAMALAASPPPPPPKRASPPGRGAAP